MPKSATGVCVGAAGAGAVVGAGAATPAGVMERSARTMRPLGPLPLISVRSIPCSAAMRRASGLARTRSIRGAGATFATGAAIGAGAAIAAGADAGTAVGAVSSSSPASVAITVPTLTPSLPSATSIEAITPSSTASNSIVALSVSISARMSPEATLSPALTSHLARVPSSMVGESAGILMAIGMARNSVLVLNVPDW